MFGERYFATRERLAGLMRGIAALGVQTGADLRGLLPLDEAENGLGSPFLFVVCGEVNAGKSTLLNGLFGRDLCKVNILPETDRVLWYRHGPLSKDVELTPFLEERYRPVDFLRDFNLVDTPGTNSIVRGHQDITERFLPVADLLLFVFPVSNPWGAATWDFISRMPKELLGEMIFIIQQADQREPADIAVILDHMRDLSMKRIGRVPPMFAVSGKQAWQAKSSSPFAADLLKSSGYPALEDFISRRVCESPARKAMLETWRSQSATALRKVEDRIEDQTRSLNQQSRFLEEIEAEIDSMREQFVDRLPRHLSGVAEVFQTEAAWVSKILHQRLGALSSIRRLFTGDRTGHQMESLFIERLQGAIEAVAENDGTEVASACRNHWDELRARVQNAMGIDLGGTDVLDETLATARTRFIHRLGRAARQGIGNLKVRNQLDKELRRRNLALTSFTATGLLFLTAGATTGALRLHWLLPLVLCSAAGLFLLGGLFTAWYTRKPIVADFRERLLDTCGTFANTLRSDSEEALRIVFQDYTDSLDIVRKHLAQGKSAVEPRLRTWKELFLTLKAIEQDL
jgi:predicted GTPase